MELPRLGHAVRRDCGRRDLYDQHPHIYSFRPQQLFKASLAAPLILICESAHLLHIFIDLEIFCARITAAATRVLVYHYPSWPSNRPATRGVLLYLLLGTFYTREPALGLIVFTHDVEIMAFFISFRPRSNFHFAYA